MAAQEHQCSNVQVQLDGQRLALTVDLKQTIRETPKSEIVASSENWATLEDAPVYAFSLTVIRRKGGKAWGQR